VLWLSIALSAIAFALARSVRTELERAAFNVDSMRAYYLAKGGIERAMLHMLRSPVGPADPSQGFRPGQNWMHFAFAAGAVDVQIEGEGGKVDINQAPAEAVARVLAATGLDPAFAVGAATRLVETRRHTPWSSVPTTGSGANLSTPSTFSRPGASFQELEELLVLPGFSADVLYGTYARDAQGSLRRVGGLNRQLTVYGGAMVDANYASREVLSAAGLPTSTIDTVMQIRAQRPLQPQDPGMSDISNQVGPLRLGLFPASSAYTLRATARLQGGRGVRTVAALIKLAGQPDDPPIRVVRWYDVDF
jgi:type II secretory pathway component PulK